jgi:hypothetical protein
MTNPSSNSNSKERLSSDHEWMSVVVEKIQNLRFGSVQITVHDGRVTLVESVEKTRFPAEANTYEKKR